MILLATMTPNCFNLSLQSNYKVVGSLVERSHAEFNATMWYDGGTTEKKLDGLGFRIDNQALITQVTTFLRLSPSFKHIFDRFINIHSSVLSKRLGVL